MRERRCFTRQARGDRLTRFTVASLARNRDVNRGKAYFSKCQRKCDYIYSVRTVRRVCALSNDVRVTIRRR